MTAIPRGRGLSLREEKYVAIIHKLKKDLAAAKASAREQLKVEKARRKEIVDKLRKAMDSAIKPAPKTTKRKNAAAA